MIDLILRAYVNARRRLVDDQYLKILGISLALLTGIAAGALHGFIVMTFHVPAFLVTFATQSEDSAVSLH